MSIIEAKDITRKFNGFIAVDRVSFTVEKGPGLNGPLMSITDILKLCLR